jgi:hypothetical protein
VEEVEEEVEEVEEVVEEVEEVVEEVVEGAEALPAGTSSARPLPASFGSRRHRCRSGNWASWRRLLREPARSRPAMP